MSENINTRAAGIRLLLLDVDGVLTDGRLYITAEGEAMKAFNTLDGHGIKMLQRSGVRVGIITGRKSAPLQARAKELGIKLLVQGREDKLSALKEILEEHPMPMEEIAFVGDDLPDLDVMVQVGLSISVPAGHEDVRKRAHYITHAPGGAGAVREVCDMLLKAQGNYPKLPQRSAEDGAA